MKTLKSISFRSKISGNIITVQTSSRIELQLLGENCFLHVRGSSVYYSSGLSGAMQGPETYWLENGIVGMATTSMASVFGL